MKVTIKGRLIDCPDCGATHLGSACGSTWRGRLVTQTVDPSWMPAREKKNYYDAESIHDLFGEDAQERMEDETKGIGPVSQEEWESYTPLRESISNYYLDGPEEELDPE